MNEGEQIAKSGRLLETKYYPCGWQTWIFLRHLPYCRHFMKELHMAFLVMVGSQLNYLRQFVIGFGNTITGQSHQINYYSFQA
jgi:hypothetical protein